MLNHMKTICCTSCVMQSYMLRAAGFVVFICLFSLCLGGCGFTLPEWSDDFISREIYGLGNGVSGDFHFTCTDGEKIFYYDDYAIYSYGDGQTELVTELDEEKDYFLDKMACTSEYLYYYCGTREDDNETVRRVNLATGDVENLDDVYDIDQVSWMVSHGEDVWIQIFREIAENKEWIGELLYIGGNKTAETITIGDKERLDVSVGGYRIRADYENAQYLWICAEDGDWQCCGGPRYSSEIQWKIRDTVVQIDNCDIILNGKQIAVGEDIRGDEEKRVARTKPEFCSVYGDEVYLLYEYRNTGGGAIATDVHKGRDAIYRLDTGTGKLELVYQADEMPTQIATYSVEKGVVYLLKLDGLYRVDVDFHGTNDLSEYTEEKVLDLNRETNGIELVFSECGGKLFVFDNSIDTKLLKVIEQ